MVDALAPDGSDQPLGEAVLPRRRQGAAAPTEERLTLERPQRSADPRHDAGVATGAGIFGPRAAKAAIEGMAERVAVPPNHPYPRGGWSSSSGHAGVDQNPNVMPVDFVDMNEPASWVIALQDRALRGELESLYYERVRWVNYGIDPDIDVYRSFLHMAKLTFQRQRIVARQMASRQQPKWSSRCGQLFERFFGKHISGMGLHDD